MEKLSILSVLTSRRITGNIGEKIAAKQLRREGYRILQRNYVAVGHEIDIIAENRDTIVFVEVKSRTVGSESPLEPRPASAVNAKKQRGILAAAQCYILLRKPDKKIRFDIVEVYLSKDNKKRAEKVVHIPGAFTKDTAYHRR